LISDDIAALRWQTDVVVAPCHWLHKQVLGYMRGFGHAR